MSGGSRCPAAGPRAGDGCQPQALAQDQETLFAAARSQSACPRARSLV